MSSFYSFSSHKGSRASFPKKLKEITHPLVVVFNCNNKPNDFCLDYVCGKFSPFCEKYFLNSHKLILKKECQKKRKKKKKLGRNFGESHSPVPTSYLINIFISKFGRKLAKITRIYNSKTKFCKIFPLFLCRKIAKFHQKKEKEKERSLSSLSHFSLQCLCIFF